MPAWCRDALSASAQVLEGERTHDEEHALLRRTGAVVARDPQRFGVVFHRLLFARTPALRVLFPAAMDAHHHRLGESLDHVLASLDRPDVLGHELGELGRRHRGYGAIFVHYLAFGEALIEALAELNGAQFDSRARLAWSRLYSWVVYRMRHVPAPNEAIVEPDPSYP